jgi:DNA-binding response OmpR family regulator
MYRFGKFALDPRRHTLSRGDSPIFLTPKAFDVLFFLLQNPNRSIHKSDAALKKLIAKYGTREAFWIASVYAFRNQRDEAFVWLTGLMLNTKAM